jgi:hypothetical protein
VRATPVIATSDRCCLQGENGEVVVDDGQHRNPLPQAPERKSDLSQSADEPARQVPSPFSGTPATSTRRGPLSHHRDHSPWPPLPGLGACKFLVAPRSPMRHTGGE